MVQNKAIQTKSHKEAYTLRKRENGKISLSLSLSLYIYKRKRAIKSINKSTNDNKL